ncbi:High-affinity zinc uptake system protein ZnuA [BD1-7 clade bacterium]|uniref:High-affinity zinc uptake system protein ZnuA n=1 Tax=BD1-7 clade bacterium TaxID=2029982 RepID=A0A5S9MZ20_9GAMM|nr:High-affinity zinc uptake system protein ZnuA [BD1-7 clade bacterium]CAA0083651.1 High-affinity zinc uptake system protein ZnuA [BD1-7 clade bacterium]
MIQRLRVFFISALVVLVPAYSQAQPVNTNTQVLVSIKPLALIYAALTAPQVPPANILVPADANLHDFSLSIRQLDTVSKAGLIFWLGPKTEPYLADLAQRFKQSDQQWVLLQDQMHGWLEPDVAADIATTMAQALVQRYPAHKSQIEQRLADFQRSIHTLETTWQRRFTSLSDTPFLLGHSAFEHLTHELGLTGAVEYQGSHSHGHAPTGMQAMLSAQKRIAAGEIRCAVEEPDVDFSRLQQRFSQLRIVRLSPMAADTQITAGGYVDYLDSALTGLYQCLTGHSAANKSTVEQ